MRLVSSLSVVAFLTGQILGHPASVPSSRGLQGRAVDFNAFRLNTVTEYKNSTETVDTLVARSFEKRDTYLETATAFLKKISPDVQFRVADDHYVGNNGIAHVNFKQTVHGLDIDNADFNVNVI